MLVEVKQITVPPGNRLLVQDVGWQDFEAILADLGEHRGARVAYDNSILEIITPLAGYESSKQLTKDLLTAILEELDIEFWPLGSTTFTNHLLQIGIEPDDCFYIENEAAVRGKDRLDLTKDPPPDFALEIDVTSRTHPSIYEKLGVSELWRFEKGKLKINVLQNGRYVESDTSLHFQNLPVKEAIPQYLDRCKIQGRNQTMKAFRAWVRSQI
ncbi:MAG: Uma2 family endonuclease [Hormoscilla sp.]